MKKKKIFKVLYMCISAIFIASAIITTVMILSFDMQYACPKFGNHILVSVNDSELSPKILKGSALLSDLKYDKVEKGDYVIITTKSMAGIQYSARRLESVEDEYYLVSGTEGRGPFYVNKSSVMAVSKMQIYGLGGYINMMRTRNGFLLLVIIPLVIVIIIQVIRMLLLIQEKKLKEQYANVTADETVNKEEM
ncbi:MAG TPA: hypothetical protein PLZ06_08965 [Clostridia bacterium]|nr:hypothetical protein [Clostridia bacterium]